MFRKFIFSALLASSFFLVSGVPTGFGQGSGDTAEPQSGTKGSQPSEKEKIEHLQAQIEAMQRQIDELKLMISSIAAAKQDELGPLISLSRTDAVSNIVVAETSSTRSEPVTQEKRELGVDIGHARLTPYGSIYFNAFSNSGGTNNADVPLFATPSGRGGTGASLRQTRLGLRLERFKIAGANAVAVLEADFFGGFPSVGIGENFGIVRLRLANLRMNWKRTSVTVGQDWSVFAPVNPTSLAAAAIPQLAAAGNNWARLPQIKLEQKLGSATSLQVAVAAQQTGDSATNAPFFLQPNSGAASRIPFFQGRIGHSFQNSAWSGRTGSIAVSAHYGRSRVFVGSTNTRYEIDSFGAAADWNIPLLKRLTLAGEAFLGRNLAGFQAGVFQGYNPEFAYRRGNSLVPAGVRAIGTRGGWSQLGFTPSGLKERLSLYASFGIDDPRNVDLTTVVPRDLRSRNLAIAFDAIYKVSPQFSLGAEFRKLQTDWTISGRHNSNHVNLGAVYSF